MSEHNIPCKENSEVIGNASDNNPHREERDGD